MGEEVWCVESNLRGCLDILFGTLRSSLFGTLWSHGTVLLKHLDKQF